MFTIFSYAAIMAGKLIIFTSLNDGQILDHPSKRVPVVFVSLETFTKYTSSLLGNNTLCSSTVHLFVIVTN